MKRAIGPIVTTGMALVVSGVIVANPVVAPRADVQIPAVQLSSGSGEAGGMLDEAFLNAIAPAPPESTNPFAVLKQLVSSLVADATFIGKNAIVDAFVAGVTAVSEPELTAAWAPYVAPPAELSAVAASVLPGLQFPDPATWPDVPIALPDPVVAVGDALSPVVKELVTSLVHDVGYVGGEMISAAFAVGAVVAAEPAMIAETLRALVKGDFAGALNSAVKVVTAPLGPPAIIIDALRTVVERRLAALVPVVAVPEAAAESDAAPAVAPPTLSAVAPAPTASALSQRPARRAPDAQAPGGPITALVPTPAAGTSAAAATAPVVDSSEIRRSTRGSVDGTAAPATRRPAALARDAVKAVGEQVGAAVNDVADAVGRTTGRAGVGRQGAAAE